MTPLPKKKHAKSRSKIRRAAAAFTLPALVACSNCKELRFPHRACPHCGFYKKGGENEKSKRPPTPDAQASVQKTV